MNGDNESHDPDPNEREDVADVVDLAVRRGLAPRVVQGELVADDEGQDVGQVSEDASAPGRSAALVRAGRVAADSTVYVVTTAKAVAVTARTVVTHDRTKAIAKGVARNGWYTIAGVGVVYGRWRDSHGGARYERMLRGAEAAGDRDALFEWEARSVAERHRRHTRIMDWIAAPIALVKAFALGVLAVAGLLLALGALLTVHDGNAAHLIGPILAAVAALAWLTWFLAAYGVGLLLTGTAGGLTYLWAMGRSRTEPPAWAAPANAGDSRDVVPDEGAILSALRNLNCPPLNRKFKEGWTPRWVLATGRDGKGWRTQLELPSGVTVEMINDRRSVLAHNLVRLPVEVWPTEPKRQPGVLDLWVADSGLLTGPVEAYPLLTEGVCDYFRGVPVGIDQRGDVVTGRLMASNYGIAGAMGSGKTSLVLNLMAGAILDPLCDVEVYVMAYNVDYDPFTPRLAKLVKGDEDVHLGAAIEALRGLRDEVTRRGKVLAELGGDETKVTRELAARDPRLRPKLVVFDECQELFRHPTHGPEAKELAIKVMMKARKCAITLVFVTPAPSADSLPRDLAKTTSHAVCFAIRDHQGNDAILGTGAHKAGVTATSLVPGEDVGTAMATGFGPRPGLLRTFHIHREKGIDEITPIVARAIAMRAKAGLIPRQGNPVALVKVDPLADVAAVLDEAGAERMRTQEVLAHLASRNRAAYGRWTFTDLRDALPDAAKPYKTAGVVQVSAARIAEALADRDAELDDPDGQGDDADGQSWPVTDGDGEWGPGGGTG